MQNLISSLAPKSKPGANLFGGGRGGVLLWIQGEAQLNYKYGQQMKVQIFNGNC